MSASITDHQHGEGFGWHSHAFGQLSFPISGVVRVLTPSLTWIIPSSRAVWVPPHVEHAIVAVGKSVIGGVYIEPDRLPWSWREPTLIVVSTFARELVMSLAEGGHAYEANSEAALSAALLLKVLPRIESVHQGSLPLPRDDRLVKICEYLLTDPTCEDSLDIWGEKLGASGRTLARHFREETGMTFRAWRQQARVIEAITRLAQGQSVTRVSADLGYGRASAFIAMFRQVTGESPQRYLASK
ncbi:AraC family transcriptional regulator [Pararobbsia silviterrae]|nr:helix-turn-helix transcriptional regulator [Pararobbsia silviterrae]